MNNYSENKAIASLVLGIISLVFIFFGYYSFIGIILAIIGLVIGIQAKNDNPDDGKAKAGVILCIIGLSLSAITFIACIACVSVFTTMM